MEDDDLAVARAHAEHISEEGVVVHGRRDAWHGRQLAKRDGEDALARVVDARGAPAVGVRAHVVAEGDATDEHKFGQDT